MDEPGIVRNFVIGLDDYQVRGLNEIAELSIPYLSEQIYDIPRNCILILWSDLSAWKKQKQLDLYMSREEINSLTNKQT
jgi:hypothetical protein